MIRDDHQIKTIAMGGVSPRLPNMMTTIMILSMMTQDMMTQDLVGEEARRVIATALKIWFALCFITIMTQFLFFFFALGMPMVDFEKVL